MAGVLKDFTLGGNVYKMGTEDTLIGSVTFVCEMPLFCFLHRKH
jgi:hypothetical protein